MAVHRTGDPLWSPLARRPESRRPVATFMQGNEMVDCGRPVTTRDHRYLFRSGGALCPPASRTGGARCPPAGRNGGALCLPAGRSRQSPKPGSVSGYPTSGSHGHYRFADRFPGTGHRSYGIRLATYYWLL